MKRLTVLLLTVMFGLAACDDDTEIEDSFEQAGENFQDAAEDTADSIDDSFDDIDN